MIFDQRQSFQSRPVGEQELNFPPCPQIAVITHRAIIQQIGYNPAAIVQGAAQHFQIPIGHRGQKFQVGGDGSIQHLPFLAFRGKGHRLHRLFRGMGQGIADIGPVRGGQGGVNAAGQMD